MARVLLTPNTTLSVGVTHLGLKSPKQAKQIIVALGKEPHAILVGDMNERTDQQAAKVLASGWSACPGPRSPERPAAAREPHRRPQRDMIT